MVVLAGRAKYNDTARSSLTRRPEVCNLGSATYQPDELTVQPAKNVGSLLRLGSVDGQPGHQDSCRLLVKGRRDALDLSLGVGPAEGGGGEGRGGGSER